MNKLFKMFREQYGDDTSVSATNILDNIQALEDITQDLDSEFFRITGIPLSEVDSSITFDSPIITNATTEGETKMENKTNVVSNNNINSTDGDSNE